MIYIKRIKYDDACLSCNNFNQWKFVTKVTNLNTLAVIGENGTTLFRMLLPSLLI